MILARRCDAGCASQMGLSDLDDVDSSYITPFVGNPSKLDAQRQLLFEKDMCVHQCRSRDR